MTWQRGRGDGWWAQQEQKMAAIDSADRDDWRHLEARQELAESGRESHDCDLGCRSGWNTL